MSLADTLRRLRERDITALSERERRDFTDELDRLRMLRLVEDGLGLCDYLPDFELLDGEGRLWSSQALLDHGPLVLALFRGAWCPYGELTMAALEDARPAIEALGACVVGVMPGQRLPAAETARRRGLGYPLLADPANAFADTCGLAYELSAGHARIHRDRGRNLAALHGEATPRLPLSAVFIAEPQARLAYAFVDVDPARWPDPQELLACLGSLRDARALSKR
jgi:peroxiredoxin